MSSKIKDISGNDFKQIKKKRTRIRRTVERKSKSLVGGGIAIDKNTTIQDLANDDSSHYNDFFDFYEGWYNNYYHKINMTLPKVAHELEKYGTVHSNEDKVIEEKYVKISGNTVLGAFSDLFYHLKEDVVTDEIMNKTYYSIEDINRALAISSCFEYTNRNNFKNKYFLIKKKYSNMKKNLRLYDI